MRSRWAAAVVLVIAACGGDGSTVSVATLPLADVVESPEHTGPTDDLAPSQITGSTVAAPDTPDPCALADLEFWTAQVLVGDQSVDAVIRVRNVGDLWCESDIGGSPLIDPEIEPDVWFEPGGWADLVVGQSGEGCRQRAIVSLAEIDVHGEVVVVPTSAVASCGWRLTAFFPNDVAGRACDDLEVVNVDRFVLVRNASFSACVLGELSQVGGNTASTRPRTDFDGLAVIDLAAGDVLAFAHDFDPLGGCDGGPGPGTLTFDVAGTVNAPEIVCGAIYELGAGRPWYGDPNGPLASFDPASFDLDEVLQALDPFDP